MKGGLVLVGLISSVLFLSVFVSAFEADSYQFSSNFSCSDFGLQCGTSRGPLWQSCGTCTTGKTCLNGKCVSLTSFGKCERTSTFNTDCGVSLGSFIYPSTIGQNEQACIYFGCDGYNAITKKCTGTLSSCSSFMEKECSTGGCSFDAETQTCINCQGANNTLGPLAWCSGPDGQKVGCQIKNGYDFNNYLPQLSLTYENTPITLSNSGALIIPLSNDDLNSIERGENKSISIIINNSGLPLNTPVNLEIYGGIGGYNYDFDTQHYAAIESVPVLVDGQGSINTGLIISKEVLSAVEYRGSTFFRIFLTVRDVPLIGDQYAFSITTKIGECKGTISPCGNQSERVCEEGAYFLNSRCTWNPGTNSCTGKGGITCGSLDNKESCKFMNCSWKANNILERFIDWIKSVFGG